MKICRYRLSLGWPLRLLFAAFLLVFSGGCATRAPSPGSGGGDSSSAPQVFPPDFETFDITMKDGARQVSAGAMDGVSRIETDTGASYVFPNVSSEVQAIGVGDVVLFSGLGLGRVSAVTPNQDGLTIDTEPATLDEFVQDGTIAWGHTVDFAQTPDSQVTPGFEDSFALMKRDPTASQLTIDPGENPTFTFAGTLEGWAVSLSVQPTSSRLNLTMSASRSVGGQTVVSISGEGFVNNFRQNANLGFAGGRSTTVQLSQDGLRGEMNVQWTAFNPGEFINNELAQLKFPVEIPIPIEVGGIPVLLKLQAIARVIPQLNFPDMSSQGSFKVVYDGSAGFSFSDATVLPVGELTSTAFSVTGDTVSAGSVTVGFGLGLEFPRVEVALLGNSASAFITLDTFASGFFEPGINSNAQPCQYGSINNQAVAGYQLSLFGLVDVSGSTEIWQEQEKFFLNGTPCDE